MDNFFIIGKTHFIFFNYLINNIGTEVLNYSNENKEYLLGPEVQFSSLVKSFFTKIYYFSDFNSLFEITFSVLNINSNKMFIYRSSTNTRMCFSNYISKKEEIMGIKLNNTNYLQFLQNDKAFIEIDISSLVKVNNLCKIVDGCILVYALVI